ncbi:MAG: phosphoribosylglycinamide formyltransferase [Candidatus Omnitrophica bacterium]|nr:phosphoribosylglycinamide formyltransferase [Candidatus Omnitrophota bacterium]MBU4148964.1 phosphoribosylglycinamide formyltransferase [Candidatus Omnitrophota bacterium]
MNIAIFCSGNGTNLQAIIDSQKKGFIKADIKLVVSDTAGCFALERAKKADIKTLVVEKKNFSSQKDFEGAILKKLKEEKIGLIVLAGYMRLLSPDFIKEYKNKILNIHPSLLPSFKGTHGIKEAFLYGVKITGPTVHFVTEDMDAGPIILQSAVAVMEDDTEETFAGAIHKEEHKIYPRAIQLFVEGKLKIEGRKVKII